MGRVRLAPVALAAAFAGAALSGCLDQESKFDGFTATPAEPQTGQAVTFDGRLMGQSRVQTVDPGTKVAWDLDGNGTFETNTGLGDGALVTSMTYSAPGQYTVGIDLGYPAGGLTAVSAISLFTGIEFFLHEYATREITVTAPPAQPGRNQPPIASFTHDADPGYTKTVVGFDAKDSTDADGRVVSYSWDFGDKSADDNTTTTSVPRATHHYASAGAYAVRLSVTDDAGAVTETERMVQVVAGSPAASASNASFRAAAARGTPFASTMVPTVMLDDGLLTMAGDAMVRGGAIVRGRFTLARRLAAPLNRTRSPRWTAGFMIKQRGRQMAVEGQLLVDFGHGDRTCLATRMTGSRGGRDDGHLSVIGGTGRAARLRGTGTFNVALKHGGPSISGRLLVAPGSSARSLPPECRTLLRASRRTR